VSPRDRALAFALPACVLLASFAAICVRAKTPWPWPLVLHEDGARTLLGTVFYGEHALRELPLDLLLAAAVAASALAFPGARRAPSGRALGAAAAAAVAAVVCCGLAAGGGAALTDALAQRVTRPGAPESWGAHWRFHLLSRLALLLAAFAAAGLHARARGARRAPRAAPFAAVLAGYALLSLVYRPSLEPVCDPVHLGHQARELFTHGLVTLPLALGAAFAARGAPEPGAGAAAWPRSVAACAALAGALALGLAAGALASGAAGRAQHPDPVRTVAVHFFEHAPGYALVPLVAAWLVRRGARGITRA
jgi:hypothetical protein